MNIIEIYEPRWHDRTVLVATYKVKSGYNYIKFTKVSENSGLKGKLYRFHSTEINTNRVQSNGRIPCFAIPMEILELVEEEKKEETPIKHSFKVEIDGVSREFDNSDEFVKALAEFLSMESK